jgi:hypothetical protein
MHTPWLIHDAGFMRTGTIAMTQMRLHHVHENAESMLRCWGLLVSRSLAKKAIIIRVL